MALSMHTNYASLVTQNTLNNTSELLNTAMERLSTGYRINSAADDAAGLQISNRLEMNSRGMSVAQRNAQDGISMLQTAEGAFDEVTNILYRMNDLATQAANGTNSADDNAALNAEFAELTSELDNIMSNTTYAGETLLTTSGIKAGGLTLQIGSSASETLDLATTVDSGVGAAFDNLVAGYTGIDTQANASTTMGELSAAIDLVGSARAGLGATMNRLDHTITNLGNMIENTDAAKGRLTDADFAVETSNMTKNQMLMQAGTNVLSRTNQLSSLTMSLLG
ncbi:Lateral flagellin [Vibrio sp. HA2012]|uniref:lateral flagellin LafA n=1 Tax=Vibrio sp. HA2012 TaxID=1971595 RepID=UPI000C2BDB6A|nr:lateral flagellin LafA [Vibrio sp. HA2012]PJC86430.1 Lateral flagellin [Vibrio sp. HA2012]